MPPPLTLPKLDSSRFLKLSRFPRDFVGGALTHPNLLQLYNATLNTISLSLTPYPGPLTLSLTP